MRNLDEQKTQSLIRTPRKDVNASRSRCSSLRSCLRDIVGELHVQVVGGLDLVARQDANGDSDGEPELAPGSDASHSEKKVKERTRGEVKGKTTKQMKRDEERKRESNLRAEKLVPVLRTIYELADQLARLQELHVFVVAALRLGEVVLEDAAVNGEARVV